MVKCRNNLENDNLLVVSQMDSIAEDSKMRYQHRNNKSIRKRVEILDNKNKDVSFNVKIDFEKKKGTNCFKGIAVETDRPSRKFDIDRFKTKETPQRIEIDSERKKRTKIVVNNIISKTPIQSNSKIISFTENSQQDVSINGEKEN